MNIKVNLRTAGFLLLFTSLLISSCSTKKNTFTRRVYHNLTAHYNAYWNGNESLKEGARQLNESIEDDFNQILPVYNYGTKSQAQTVNQSMDKAIEKASMVIQQHSMKFKGKEHVRWIDDAYMLIGKAYFYKQEYFSARRTFRFVMGEYGENDIRFAAMVWLGKTYIQMEAYEQAEPLLTELYNSEEYTEIPFKVRREIPLVLANMYIQQEKYQDALDYLYRGVEVITDRDLKTRLIFILAQIQQKEENLDEASRLYLDVVKRNPPYDMAFQAKINLARSYEAESGNKEEIVKTLNKMLRDIKNEDYKDQIYYALSEIALTDGQDTLAIHYLRKSVATSVNNDYQKATSSLKLGQIYFDLPDYQLSQAYYDTAMQVLPEDYPDYEEIKSKTTVLTSLVDNLVTIQLQDSLQRLAAMPQDERLAIIDKIIEEKIEEEKRRMEMEALRQQNMRAGGQQGFSLPGQGGSWYFYSSTAKSQGFTEFKRKWGDRKLEDLWRLKNKQLMSFGEEEMAMADTLGGDSLAVQVTNPKTREFYLKDIPTTEEQLIASNQMIMEAYYGLGRLYKEGLNDYGKSGQAFETLIQRFPDTKYLLQAYYNLYKVYLELGQNEKAAYYKNLLLTDYPESDYAKVIENPNYFKELNEQQNEVGKLYEKTYSAYKTGQYFMVINYSDMALIDFPESKLIPKFLYLRALSLGKVEVKDSLLNALEKIVRNYPDSEVEPLAMNILQKFRIDSTQASPETKKTTQVQDSPFKISPNESHFFAIVVINDSVNVPAMKVRMSDFNKKYFSIRKLTINNLMLDNQRQIITVANYSNKEDAMNYYNLFRADDYVVSNINKNNYQTFVISVTNYPILFKDKIVQKYLEFFEENYVNTQ